ncbi:uncharacterized protein DUF721 [Dyadobacter jejuensis]|uniref:Uncharacterized protein DUF721 n=2 Tax=Dyadobacter jejuensis TaxID=1082580 RepID=A0A316AKY6_9BACT|nr:uncharacterized protein DUF721 [Dyadobacter jejuensis]
MYLLVGPHLLFYLCFHILRLMAQQYRFDREKASRRPGVTPLKDAIEQMLDKYQLRNRFEQSYVVAHWDKIMGSTIASRTKKVFIKDRSLYLQIESAPLRNELVRAKSKIIELINREMGSELVEDVIFI